MAVRRREVTIKFIQAKTTPIFQCSRVGWVAALSQPNEYQRMLGCQKDGKPTPLIYSWQCGESWGEAAACIAANK